MEQAKFQVGSRFHFQGEECRVTAFVGKAIMATTTLGKAVRIDLAALFADPTFVHRGVVVVSPGRAFDNLTDAQKKLALEREAHVLEVLTGYRRGMPDPKFKNEPLDDYDLELTTLTERIDAKAKELRIEARTLWRWKGGYEAMGASGLVDRRQTKLKTAAAPKDVLDALTLLLNDNVERSNKTKTWYFNQTRKALEDKNLPFPMKATTFNLLVDELKKQLQFADDAKQRRNNAGRPETTYGHFRASRPGELVAIDATPLDVFGIDSYTGKWMQVRLSIALDIATRSIVGWKLTPGSDKAVDATMLLHEVIKPKRLRPGWDQSLRWAYVGVPEQIVIDIGGDPENPSPVAHLPFLHPESVIVDRGRVYLSQTFMTACRVLGVNVMVARPQTPTDKAQVERVFRTLRDGMFQYLKGYKGPDVKSRGKDVEGEAIYFIEELEEALARFIIEKYQREPHDGLNFEFAPKLEISPNHMIDEGIARAGFVFAPPRGDYYLELLPDVWRHINHYGVQVQYIVYDGDCLNGYRDTLSDHLAQGGKWRFKIDPRDISVAYFQDPTREKWHQLKWTGADERLRPFSVRTRNFAKQLIAEQGFDVRSHVDLSKVINQILDDIEREALKGPRERRMAALTVEDGRAAQRDRLQIEDFSEEKSESDMAKPQDFDAFKQAQLESATPQAVEVRESRLGSVYEDNNDDDYVM